MASSRVEEYEGAMERGDEGVLNLPQVAETREELSTGLLCFSPGKPPPLTSSLFQPLSFSSTPRTPTPLRLVGMN